MITLFKIRKVLSCMVILFVLCFFTLSCASSKTEISKSQKKIPLWTSYETLNAVFPEDDFLARIGTGASENLAKLNADSELSFYFSAKIENAVLASENYLNQNDKTSVQRQVSKNILLEGNSELVALRHTDFYFDENRTSFTVCSYINRNEAWNLIEAKLQPLADFINSSYLESQKQNENFLKIRELNSVLQKADEFYNLYFLAAGIVSQKAKEFSATQNIIQKAQTELAKLKQESVIFVNVQGDDSGRIKTKIAELLSKNGFSVTSSQSEKFSYLADATVNAEISKNDEFFVSYPQILFSVKTLDSKTLLSFAKSYGKVASYTKDACSRMVLSKIENELEENVMLNLFQHL